MVRRRFIALALACIASLGTAVAPVAAESALWTLVASPLVATTGVASTFVLTATNEDPLAALLSSSEIGCVAVDVPATFDVDTAAVTGSSMNGSWAASVAGNRVQIQTSSGGDRLELLDWVRFAIGATPLAAGQLAWPARAYRNEGCTGTGALVGVPPLVLVAGPAVTPTPAPTPIPTVPPTPSVPPLATLVPVPLPSVGVTLPPILGTPSPAPRPVGLPPPVPDGAPTPGPASSEAPRPSILPRESAPAPTDEPSGEPSDAGAGPVGEEPRAGAPAGGPPDSAESRPTGEGSAAQPIQLSLGPLGLIGSLDVWTVPGIVIGVPGLLIALFALLQAIGAAAWLPAIRRLRDDGPTAPTPGGGTAP